MGPATNNPLSYALMADGTSDRCLLPIIAWSLRQLWRDGYFAPPVFIPRQHAPIEEKLVEIVQQYKPDLVFVHRDAENQPYEIRLAEIPKGDTTVPIIPVRMTEAWLLIDEHMLRWAAGNPNGRQPLEMPMFKHLERLNNPKSTLYSLLRTASGNTGRRLRKFNAPEAAHRLAELIEDYSALCGLAAYRCFYDCLESALRGFIERESKNSGQRDVS